MQAKLLQKFDSIPFDKSCIGLGKSDEVISPYWCTPVGAEIIGWLGVDGIHFCLIPNLKMGQGEKEKVYVISPMPIGEQFVYPVANHFLEFLSLVAACGDAGILESISWTSEDQFNDSLKANFHERNGERDQVIKALQDTFQLKVCPNLYQHVKHIQAYFDYTQIPFSEEYDEIMG